MNTRPVIEDSKNPVALSVSFNQDRSCFSVGLETGYCSMSTKVHLLHSTNKVIVLESDPCAIRASKDFKAGIGAAEMLGRANYVALVGGGKNPMFQNNRVSIFIPRKFKQS